MCIRVLRYTVGLESLCQRRRQCPASLPVKVSQVGRCIPPLSEPDGFAEPIGCPVSVLSHSDTFLKEGTEVVQHHSLHLLPVPEAFSQFEEHAYIFRRKALPGFRTVQLPRLHSSDRDMLRHIHRKLLVLQLSVAGKLLFSSLLHPVLFHQKLNISVDAWGRRVQTHPVLRQHFFRYITVRTEGQRQVIPWGNRQDRLQSGDFFPDGFCHPFLVVEVEDRLSVDRQRRAVQKLMQAVGQVRKKLIVGIRCQPVHAQAQLSFSLVHYRIQRSRFLLSVKIIAHPVISSLFGIHLNGKVQVFQKILEDECTAGNYRQSM